MTCEGWGASCFPQDGHPWNSRVERIQREWFTLFSAYWFIKRGWS
jgi:hypothetical protein